LIFFTIDKIIDIHLEVAKIGRTNKTGVRSKKYLELIYNEFQLNVQEQIDIIYIVTKVMKSIVHYRPFKDVNRRTLFETGQMILRTCGLEMKMSEQEAIEFKNTLRPKPFKEVYNLVQAKAKRIS
jgi:prophage maintenance system killer protein